MNRRSLFTLTGTGAVKNKAVPSARSDIFRAEMSVTRDELIAALEEYYRSCGLRPERAPDGTVRARGFGGVTWIGLPVSGEDFDDAGFEARLVALGDERMPTGELCPLEMLPSPDCAERLYGILERVGLGERGNVEVYAAA